ncbi:MAG: LbtU family siderophore porin [Desulfosarcina sp.]|nr:LbtU family siderophore porin [Desulfosarcina sp.]MBC2767901.1 LbtU family siderophore porin [Desulfosarcina sp.]
MIKVFFFLVVAFAIMGFAQMVPAAEPVSEEAAEQKAGGVKSLEKRVKQLEEAIDRPVEGDKWYDRLQISGLIEVEAGYEKIDFNDPAEEDEKNSDVDLATVELVVDARIIDHVDGHVLFKYEEDDVFVDEGFITLTGSEAFPAYLIAGRQYIPFGYFDSHFVTDPNTLVLGETNEGSVVAGYRFGGEMIDVSVGAFNGKIDKAGDDDAIDSVVASIVAQPFEAFMIGASYTSNLASSDAFSEVFEVDEVDDLVGGWSAFVTFQFLERFKLIGEYVAALDNFKAGEIYDAADTKEREPSAWNVELGAAIIDSLELAVRYGGSDDGGADFLPESQYGAVLNWGFFENTNLALEYLHGEFEDDAQETDVFTAQLAVEF